MSRSTSRARKAAAILALAVVVGGPAHAVDTPSIVISGTGAVTASPDTGNLSAGVSTEAETAADAARANSAAMQRVLEALEAGGIAKKDVRTEHFQVHPVYGDPTPASRERPRITGYRVSNQVTVRVRDLDKVGAVLDAVMGAGANEIAGISFSLADPAPLLDEARKRALADARRKAELFAATAGVGLGRLLELSEDDGGMPGPMPRMAPMSAAESVPIATGEMEFSVTVRARYAIEP